MLSRTPPSQIASIQILRAVAALAIALHHSIYEADRAAQKLGGAFKWQQMLPLEMGVDLFFVISGFVMVHASRDLFGSSASIQPFLRRRLARIAPIYWLTTFVFIALAFTSLAPLNREAPSMLETAASLLFIPYLRPDGFVQPVYSLGWTLNYEMFFYALFALALPWTRERAVPILVGALMALVLIGQFIPYTMTIPYYWTRPIILEFAFGAMIGHMALSGVKPGRNTAIMLCAGALVILVAGAYSPALSAERVLAYGLPAALLVIAALAFEQSGEGNVVTRSLVRLGDASYALYLLHPFVLRGLSVVAGTMLAGISPILFIIVGLAAACIVSLAVWRWFEKPVTKALQGPKPL